MSAAIVRLRTLAVRVGFWLGSARRPAPRVVLATSHAATLSRQPRLSRGGAGRAAPGDPGHRPRLSSAGRRRAAASRAIVRRRSSRLPPRRRPRLRRRRLLLPDLRDHAASGHAAAPGLARGRRVQEVRLQRPRPVVRRRRGVRAHASRSTATTASRSCRRMSVAPFYAEAFGQPVDAVHVALRAPADRPVRRPGPPGPGAREDQGALRPPGRPPDRPLRADVPRRLGRPGALRRPARPAASCTTSWATTTSSCSGSTRSCATRW